MKYALAHEQIISEVLGLSQQLNLKLIADDVANFLKTKEHTEKPHISALGPPKPSFLTRILREEGVSVSRRGPDLEGEEDDDETLETDVLYTRPAWWITGCKLSRIKVHNEEDFAVTAKWKFYIRAKPPKVSDGQYDHSGCYKRVEVAISLGGRGGFAELNIYGDSGAEYSSRYSLPPFLSNQARVVFAAPLGTSAYLMHKRAKPTFEGRFSDAEKHLRVSDASTSKAAAKQTFTHAFCWALSIAKDNEGAEVESLLLNLGGYFPGGDNSALSESTQVYVYDSEGKRWSVGYLFEVEGSIDVSRGEIKYEWGGHGLKWVTPYNTMAFMESGQRLLLRDYAIEEETVPGIEESANDLAASLSKMLVNLNLSSELESAVAASIATALMSEGGKIERLRVFQEEAFREILKGALSRGESRAIVIMARAAGGKTLSFLLPLLFYAAVCKGRGMAGTKAIIFYPTKALANDQLDEIARLVYFMNASLEIRGYKRAQVSVGILHGDVPSRFENYENFSRKMSIAERIYCPIHQSKTFSADYRAEQGCWGSFYVEELKCEDECRAASALSKWIKLTREAIYSDPPDILISDIDIFNKILMEDPSKHSIFGREVLKCPRCGSTYAELDQRKCSLGARRVGCGGQRLLRVSELCYPEVIVLDEAHTLRGSFGIQAHYVLRRIEQAIRAYKGLPRSWRPLYVLSSATLRDGEEEKFVRELLELGPSDCVKVIKAREVGFEEKTHKRYFLFLMPKAYAPQATAVRALKRAHDRGDLKGIVFVNRLAESNELINSLADLSVKGIRVLGHSTDYDPQERVMREVEFNRATGSAIFVATQTLELGVDYGHVHYVALYGMPYYLSELIQRIGRAGRVGDALIILIFNPDHPVDYFFYTNYKLISDGRLREGALSFETWAPYLRNDEAIKRSICRAALDYLCVKASQGREKDFVSAQNKNAFEQIIRQSLHNPALEAYIEEVSLNLKRPDMINEVRKEISSRAANHTSIIDLANDNGIRQLYLLWQLRHSDREVLVDFGDFGRRMREESMAVRTYNRGQICSYKGLFFTATPVLGRRLEGV
ncbi:MAG: helicase-related protein [Nitrososphaerota archaeon]